MTEQKIAIVGAGLGGLATALSLLRRGLDVDVYEQASSVQEVGAGVQISANGTRVLYELGLQNEVLKLGSLAAGKEIRLWSSGQKWKLFISAKNPFSAMDFLTCSFTAPICMGCC